MEEKLTTLLKAETAAAHQRTEALLYTDQLFKGTLSAAQYAHLLQIHLQFHVALEKAIGKHSELTDLLPSKASKSDMVLKDLDAIGQAPMPCEADRLSHLGLTQLIGALYVSEGSMLGGAVIARAIAKTQGLQDHEINFFNMYGKDLGAMWIGFCSRLNDRPRTEWPAIIEGAQFAFDLYSELFHATKPVEIHG